MPSSSILALATAVTGASAAFQGFNYESKGNNQQSFEAQFKNAQGLEGTNGGFTSARLYTMIQDGTANDPISAIPAAISTKTSLLFGLWGSGGQAQFDNEISALKKTASKYCDQLDGLVAGISVGSEDLYRDSPIGQAAGENPGAGPKVLLDYVQQTRDAIKGTCLEKAPIGHVDTWTAFANSTNKVLSDGLDWVGMDAYPYYENQKDNSIDNAKELFQAAIDNTNTGTGGKPLWITETASTTPRPSGARLAAPVNVFWFLMQDGGPSQSDKPSFGLVGGNTLSTKPLFDLSCDGYTNGGSSSSSSSSSASVSTSSSSQQSTSSASGSATGTATGSQTQTSASGTSGGGVPVTSGAPSTMSTSAAPSSSSAPAGSGSQSSNSQPAGTGVVPSRTATTPSGSNTPTPVGSNSAAGLNSVAAAVAALMAAVAAF
ncbi:hypothetical protein LLEC1_03139 [Akanthomyces lecanii]|uniref:glucan endo-1,3-beta-D-glucosidase n=1 Tax=Cordyceps confragosa TaxID=2714763 RepID=A0A179IG76_CORDF|nr:hypothetical protein LLEC1_03139 [Akanthomyces lecanii]